jgi:hypothetical protein
MSIFTMRAILYTGALLIAAGACTGIVEAPDEGAGATTVAVCSSNVFWKEADTGSEFMHPGGKCSECHAKNTMAPDLSIAGTVYPTLHEPDECNGVNSIMSEAGTHDVSVVITDGSGRSLPPIAVNKVGNFRYEQKIIPPFKVKVVRGDKENKMVMSPPHGDCNACHTQAGANSAPGRITIPQ